MITPSFGLTATEWVLPKLALNFTTGLLDSRVTFTRTGNTATVIGFNGLLQSVNADIPRFDYNATTLQCKGLLIEENSVNLLTYSQDFSNPAWSVATNITVATSATVDPAGGTGAYSITAGAASATFGRTITGTAGLSYTYSFWIRRKTGVGGVTVAVGDGNFQSISAQVSSAWNRVSVTSLNTSTTTIRAYIALTVSGNAVEIYGAQLEQKAFATSYIPTVAATVTRNADIATMTGTNFSNWWYASEGAAVIQALPSTISNTRPAIQLDDNTANESIALRGVAADPQLFVVDGGGTQATLDAGTITANTVYKLGGAWKASSFATAINGAAAVTSASGTLPTVTQARLGSDGTNYFNGHLQNLRYWPQRLTNSEVQAFSK